jgi:cytidylate kinase
MPLSQFNLRQVLGSLRTVSTPGGHASQGDLPHWPFVTISREAGTGGMTVGRLLAAHLNGSDPPEHPWQCLDRELVERIAADHHMSTSLVESLEHSSHTWIEEFLGGLSRSDDKSPSELAVFRRSVETVRALARAGRVILVGLGGVLIARDMPGAIHVRLIADLEWRIANLARNDQLSPADAKKRVLQLDRERQAFIARFFPTLTLTSEMFHVTLNASTLSDAQMAEAIAGILRFKQ